MAFITVSGFPSSGKSRRATQLYEFLSSKIQSPCYEGPFRTIEVISDDSLGLERSVYDGLCSPTYTRDSLKGAQKVTLKSLHEVPSSLQFNELWLLIELSSLTPLTTSKVFAINSTARQENPKFASVPYVVTPV